MLFSHWPFNKNNFKWSEENDKSESFRTMYNTNLFKYRDTGSAKRLSFIHHLKGLSHKGKAS